MTNF
jgi:tetratricopeptide (TPR) repeat protein